MTELEKHIYDSVKDRLPELLEKVRELKFDPGTKRVNVPFAVGGCIDWLVYSPEEDRFIEIEYGKGVKNGTSIGGLMSDMEAYFHPEDIKTFTFQI